MEQKIRIQGVDALIEFIESHDIDFNTCLEIVNSFTEQPIFWEGEKSKSKLIEFIKQHKSKINGNNIELPLFNK